MNEITRIHVARIAYSIDIDAKKELDKYSREIKKSLGQDSDVYDDIEIRMTEILASRGVAKDDVITSADVAAIRKQLGEPSDFADESDAANENVDSNKPRRRFYRDEDNGILGGLAAGLAAYTNWDVVLWRVIFLILIPLTSGFAILAYIVMWIVTPAAKTASEKLEMRGEPINIDSIKEAAKNFGGKASDIAKDASEKAASASHKTTEAVKTSGPRVGHTILRAILVLIGIGFLLAAIGVFAGTIIGGVTLLNAAIVAGTWAGNFLMFATMILGLVAGISFAVIWLVLALVSFAGKFRGGLSKTLVASVIICVVAGIAGVSTGVSWFFATGQEAAQQTWHKIERVYNPDIAYTVDEVKVTAPSDVEIAYRAGKHENISVDNMSSWSAKSAITINKTDDKNLGTINIKIADDWRKLCGQTCPEKLRVELSGPFVREINGGDVQYSE